MRLRGLSLDSWQLCIFVYILIILYEVPDAASQAYLIVTDTLRNGVFRMDISGGNQVQFPVPSLKNPIGVGVNPEDSSVFVTERGTSAANSEKFILKYSANVGSPRRLILDRISVPDGLAVDPITRLVYYTDAGEDYIAVSNTDLSWHAVVLRFNLDQPRGIALDSTQGTMYWTDWGTGNPHIGKAYMDGSQPKRIITQDLGFPNGLVLDPTENYMFWCDAKTFVIERARKDGSARKILYRRPLEHFFGIVLDGTYLYWTSWNKRAIQRGRKDGTGTPENLGQVFAPNSTRMNGLAIVNPSVIPTGSNACSPVDRGGCQQLCLPRKSNRTCACTDGFVLNSDGTTCAKMEFKRSLILVDQDRDGIFRMDLDKTTSIRIPIRGSRAPQGIAYDPQTNNIFWTDAALKVVATGTLDGARASVLKRFTNPEAFPEGIALDPIARKLYVVDSGRDVIIRLATDGTGEEVLISGDLTQPRAIALDLTRRRMYWTDWGSRPMIARSGMDGKSRKVVIDREIKWPNGLAIDVKAARIYWTDGFLHRIESANLEGGDRQIILSDSSTHYLGLTKGPGNLYYSVRSDKAIYTVNLQRKQPLSLGQLEFRTVSDLIFLPTDNNNIPVGPPQPPGNEVTVGTSESSIGTTTPEGDQRTSPGQPPENAPNQTLIIAIAVTVGGLVLITIIIVVGIIWYRTISRRNRQPSSGVHDNRAYIPDVTPVQKGRPLPEPPKNSILNMRPPAPLPKAAYSYAQSTYPDLRRNEPSIVQQETKMPVASAPELPQELSEDSESDYCSPIEVTEDGDYSNLLAETRDSGGGYAGLTGSATKDNNRIQT